MAEKLEEVELFYKTEHVGTKVQQYEDSRVKNHWRRKKKATVDLLELPVAVDRQLADQREQMAFNRNPRLHEPTKCDKVRSEQIIAKQGNSRDVGIKAKVLNKIVREASGMHSYVIVPPPRLKGEVVEVDPDPETNPFVKLYAKETKKKPLIVSFGHRPRSASRVFNPGTMRLRMKHNEMARAPAEGKFEFGLPAGILGKLLKAPHINPAGEMPDDSQDFDLDGRSLESGSMSRGSKYNDPAERVDVHDLFSLPPDSPNAQLTPSVAAADGGSFFGNSAADGFAGDHNKSWVSNNNNNNKSQASVQVSQSAGSNRGKPNNHKGKKKLLTPVKKEIDRPAWDAAHNVISPSTRMKEVYALKANAMNDQQLTLQERLVRYNQMTLKDEQTPFCSGKQFYDMEVLRGKQPHELQKPISPVKGMPKFFDPLNGRLDVVKQRKKELDSEREIKHSSKYFQDSIAEIPKVAYHPQTLLTMLKTGPVELKHISRLAKTEEDVWKADHLFPSPDRSLSSNSNSNSNISQYRSFSKTSFDPTLPLPTGSTGIKISSPLPSMSESFLPEVNLQVAMTRAKKGDRRALFDLFMKEDGVTQSQVLALGDSSVAVSDFRYADVGGNGSSSVDLIDLGLELGQGQGSLAESLSLDYSYEYEPQMRMRPSSGTGANTQTQTHTYDGNPSSASGVGPGAGPSSVGEEGEREGEGEGEGEMEMEFIHKPKDMMAQSVPVPRPAFGQLGSTSGEQEEKTHSTPMAATVTGATGVGTGGSSLSVALSDERDKFLTTSAAVAEAKEENKTEQKQNVSKVAFHSECTSTYTSKTKSESKSGFESKTQTSAESKSKYKSSITSIAPLNNNEFKSDVVSEAKGTKGKGVPSEAVIEESLNIATSDFFKGTLSGFDSSLSVQDEESVSVDKGLDTEKGRESDNAKNNEKARSIA